MKIKYVFVFGSNQKGVHGKAAAYDAVRFYGAIYGQGLGLQGNSYAIPTKDGKLNTLPLETIAAYVDGFVQFSRNHPELVFEITRVGCGQAGYKDEQIAPLFKGITTNCLIPVEWKPYL